MFKVYFTASTSYDGEYRYLYSEIIRLIEKEGVNLVSGKQIVSEALLKKDRGLKKQEIFSREKKLIELSDCVIAETTKPSLGVGGEIVYALTQNKPVLALVYEQNEDKLSPMVAGNPSENLFLEHYHKDNIHIIIHDFLTHLSQIKKKQGKLIVIDGGDGSGKTTQAKLLVEYLKLHKIPVKYMDFPRYYSSFHGKTVAKFLRGEFGAIDQVSPYLASLAYALDRAAVKKEMEEFLQKGGFIICNRYATSNMAHQSAKFPKLKEKELYLKWIYELEYKIHRIPKEDIVIYLYVPWQIGVSLTSSRSQKKYLLGLKKDIHEKDMNHLIEAEKMYLALTQKHRHWVKIDCVKEGKLLSPQNIHEKLLLILQKKKIIS